MFLYLRKNAPVHPGEGGRGSTAKIWAVQECAAVKGTVFKQFTLGHSKYIREFGSSIEYHFPGNRSIG